MTPRTFLIALLGGALTAAAGYVPLMAVPCLVVPNWPQPLPSMLAIPGWSGAALILLLLTGLAAGWFSRARTFWGALGAGALAGWIAAWVAEALLVGVIAGLWGAKNLLAHGLVPEADEITFVFLLVESVQSIILWVHASMALTALAGMLLGALGGALGGLLGARRANPDLPFALRVSGAMTLLSSLALMVMIAVYSLLPTILQRSAEEGNFSLPFSVNLMFDAPVALSLLWWLLWTVLTWMSLRQLPAGTPIGFFSSLAFSAVGIVMGLPIAMLVGGFAHTSLARSPAASLAWILVAALLFLIVGLTLTLFVPQRRRDFFKRQGERRLMAWSLLGWNGLLFLAAFNAGPGEGWPRPWLTFGLLAGVLFGLDAVRRTPPAEDSAEAPPALTASRLFGTAFSAHLLTNLTLALTSLAPLALVMLPIVAIQYIMPDSTEMGDWISVVSDYLVVTPTTMGAAILIGTPAASLMSLLMWTIWRKISPLMRKG